MIFTQCLYMVVLSPLNSVFVLHFSLIRFNPGSHVKDILTLCIVLVSNFINKNEGWDSFEVGEQTSSKRI